MYVDTSMDHLWTSADMSVNLYPRLIIPPNNGVSLMFVNEYKYPESLTHGRANKFFLHTFCRLPSLLGTFSPGGVPVF